ncbi:MAG: hypothetical protein EXQ69_04070 [Acidimicrobiia bacterium]|nr:hypothetical protein [Acidimicrobiia bacterium]
METGLLLPYLDDEVAAPFWAACSRNELVVQTCAACDKSRMPPRPMCPHCRSIAVKWEPTSGFGTIWSYIVPHPPLLPAYAELAPYNAIVVALEEDPTIRFVGNLVTSANGAINEIDPATIRIGEKVRVVFTTIDDVTLPRWVRAD